MSNHSYTRSQVDGQWNVSLATLSKEVQAALPGKQFGAQANESAVDLSFVADLDAAEVTTLDTTVDDHKAAFSSLPKVKADKIRAIDANTERLIQLGFVYAGKVFSLSSHAQSYWNGLGNLTGNGLLTEPDDFPLEVNTLDDSSTYSIVNIADAVGVFATAAATLKGRLASGTSIKNQVRAATTVAEVEAVVDNR